MKNALLNSITRADIAILNAKNCLIAYINSPIISLTERWEAFSQAPNYLKNYEPWVCHFTFPNGTEYVPNSAYIERHQVKDMVEVVESYKDAEFDEQIADDVDWNKAREVYPDSENVIAFKEYILKNNLGSFCFDW